MPKLVDRVREITFSGANARATGQRVVYVTERAVFELAPDGIALIEVAHGIDPQRDVIDRIGFRPLPGSAPTPMAPHHFAPPPAHGEAA